MIDVTSYNQRLQANHDVKSFILINHDYDEDDDYDVHFPLIQTYLQDTNHSNYSYILPIHINYLHIFTQIHERFKGA